MLRWLIIFFFIPFMASSQSEVKIPTDKGDLEGTYLEGYQKIAVLFIAGSGPTDRNGNNTFGLKCDAYKLVADSLIECGYSSLRYDKRVIATDTNARMREKDLTFDRLIKDARFAVDWLISKGHKQIVILGHSQGSLIGMIAARQTKNIRGFISISGSSLPVDSLIVRQYRKAGAEILAEELKIKLDSIKSGHTVKKFNPFLQSLLRPSVQPFLMSYMEYDPRAEISKLDIPTLIINGTTDLQTGAENAIALHDTAKKSELVLIEGMNHVLRDAPGERTANMATYGDPSLPLSKGLMKNILEFLNKI